MKNSRLFLLALAWGGICVATYAESFLTVEKFPNTIADASFIVRMQNAAAGFAPLSAEYDADGNCVYGCAYPGIKLSEDIRMTQENTQYAIDNTPQEYNPPYNDGTEPHDNPLPSPPQGYTPPAIHIPPSQSHNCVTHSNVTSPGITTPNAAPIDGDIIITSDFGPRKRPKTGASTFHKGLDIRAEIGTNVYAVADGIVERIWDSGNGGLAVLIRHGATNYRTAYFHLSKNNILHVGANVQSGCLIAKSGNTGNSTGPHLHYAIYYTKPGSQFSYSADAIDPLDPHNLLGRNYRFKSQDVKSNSHRGKILPGEIIP